MSVPHTWISGINLENPKISVIIFVQTEVSRGIENAFHDRKTTLYVMVNNIVKLADNRQKVGFYSF